MYAIMYELRINNSLIDDAKSFYVKQKCYITISLNKNTLTIIIATQDMLIISKCIYILALLKILKIMPSLMKIEKHINTRNSYESHIA